MVIRMTHPQHGVTHATPNEVDWNKKYGWKVEEAEPPKVEAKAIEGTITKARLGRPPKVK